MRLRPSSGSTSAIRNLAIDVDNVLADSISAWCAKASRVLGKTILKSDIRSHKIVGSVKMNAEQIFSLQDEVWREWKDLPLTERNLSSKIALIRNNGMSVVIVTARPIRLTSCVRNWLLMNNIGYDEFRAIGPRESKTSVSTDALVDDDPEAVRQIVRAGKTGFLYLQPWNERTLTVGAIPVRRFNDILGYLGISS